jgi:hypothetical protein
MLSQKLFVDVSSGMFAGENRYRWHKSITSPLALLLSAPWPSHQVQAVIEELFHLKN